MKTPGRKPSKELFLDGTYDLEHWHQTFLDFEDMTEYKPAIKLCGSWKEWNRLKRDWLGLAGYVTEWKEELEILLRSRACENIQNLLVSETASVRFQASKFLSEAGWEKRASGAGRPDKASKTRAAKELASNAAETKAEEERIERMLTKHEPTKETVQ